MSPPFTNLFSLPRARFLARASAEAYLPVSENTAGRGSIRSAETDTRVLVIRSAAQVIVAFRGTADLRNWLTDLDCELMETGSFRAHRGFLRALESVFDEVSEELAAAGRRPLFLTGHSLGGALAMLCARWWRGPVAGVYTFGQPRAGDAAFRANYNQHLWPVTFRIVHANDVVARVPWLLGSYRHAGQEVFFPGGPRNLNAGKAAACLVNPSWMQKAPAEWRGLAREAWHGRDALLADHHIDSYLQLLENDPPAVMPGPGGGAAEAESHTSNFTP